MRNLIAFVRATVIGGIVFLLPFGVILIVAGKLYAIARSVGDKAHHLVFPGTSSDAGAFFFAILALVAIAFLAGILARSQLGRRVFGWFEEKLLSQVPPYTIVRQMLADMSGSSSSLVGRGETDVVQCVFDDYTALGFVIERRTDEAIVFLPGAPSALSGSVALVKAERLVATHLTPKDVMVAMRRLGAGLPKV